LGEKGYEAGIQVCWSDGTRMDGGDVDSPREGGEKRRRRRREKRGKGLFPFVLYFPG